MDYTPPQILTIWVDWSVELISVFFSRISNSFLPWLCFSKSFLPWCTHAASVMPNTCLFTTALVFDMDMSCTVVVVPGLARIYAV